MVDREKISSYEAHGPPEVSGKPKQKLYICIYVPVGTYICMHVCVSVYFINICCITIIIVR